MQSWKPGTRSIRIERESVRNCRREGKGKFYKRASLRSAAVLNSTAFISVTKLCNLIILL